MESASDSLDRLNDSLVCDICFLIFHKPTSLPCGHTFCFSCIRSFCERTASNSCPLCRHAIARPVKELSVNFALQKVVDLFHGAKWLCRVCYKKRDLERATARCHDCHKSLCASCSAQHADGRHSLTSLAKRKCANHHRKMELYCSSCRIDICVLCYSEAHRSHECDAISKVSETLTYSLKYDIRELDTWRSRLEEAQTVVESQMEKYAIHLSNLPTSDVPQSHVSTANEAFQLPTGENVDSFVTTKLKAVRDTAERYSNGNGMSDSYGHAWAMIQDVVKMISYFLAELNSHAERLQDQLQCMEGLKKRAVDMSLSPIPCHLSDYEANIQDVHRQQVFAIQKSSQLVSNDAGSTSPVLPSSEVDDQLEELMKQVTVLKDLLLREQTSASLSSSPSQPLPASEARNHVDENSTRLRPPVKPKPSQRGGQPPARRQEPAGQPQRQPKQVRDASMSPVVNELERVFAQRRRQANASDDC